MSTSKPVDDKAINEAAAKLDDATTSTTEGGGGDEQQHKEPKSIKGMMKLFHKHSDGTNVIKESITTFSNPDGSDKKGDLIVPTMNEAMVKIKELIEFDKSKNGTKKPKKIVKWEFKTSPHEQFGKTLDDTFEAFLYWARTNSSSFNDDNDDDDKKDGGDGDDTIAGYNVSKAFRRLVSYAEWMDDTDDDLVEPLTPESIKPALDAWAMKCSVDKEGNFCWWIDFAWIDINKIKKEISPKDSLRAMVWYVHYVMYDSSAQRNGIMFFENVTTKLGFIQMCTMMPMKLSTKLDRLTIGALPIKMKKMYIFDVPTWMDLLMKFMGMFMSKKMQSRIVVSKDMSIIEPLVGADAIPKRFGNLDCGKLEIDPVEAKYFN